MFDRVHEQSAEKEGAQVDRTIGQKISWVRYHVLICLRTGDLMHVNYKLGTYLSCRLMRKLLVHVLIEQQVRETRNLGPVVSMSSMVRQRGTQASVCRHAWIPRI